MFMRVRRTVPQFTFILSERFVNDIHRFPQVFSGFLRFCSVSGTIHPKKPSKIAIFFLGPVSKHNSTISINTC